MYHTNERIDKNAHTVILKRASRTRSSNMQDIEIKLGKCGERRQKRVKKKTRSKSRNPVEPVFQNLPALESHLGYVTQSSCEPRRDDPC